LIEMLIAPTLLLSINANEFFDPENKEILKK
jgi:hypothetical protein